MDKERRFAIKIGVEEVKNLVEAVDYWFHENILLPIRRTYDIIEANLSLLYFVNKEQLWWDWDYNFGYELMVWKLKRLKKRLAKDNIVAETDKICKEIEKAIYYWNLCNNPEIEVPRPQWMEDAMNKALEENNIIEYVCNRTLTPEQEQEEKEYYFKLAEVEEKGWKKFHETLKKYARGWWD